MAVSSDLHDFTFDIINNQELLKEKVRYWNTLPYIIIDTEFMRVDTFYPIPGLIQVADDHGVYLIDPIEISDLTALQPLLMGDTVKVLHSMSEDIALFQRIANCTPTNIFDTQIACALLGHGLSIGYQKLIELYLDIVIDKGETRSDWLKRPLSESQLDYAAKDVHYLSKIYPSLKQELMVKGLEGVVLSESSLINRAMEVSSNDIPNYYMKFRGGWKFDMQKQKALKCISSWREEEARRRDKPRSRIISDKQILEIVENTPKSYNGLRSSNVLNSGQIRRYGEQVMSLITESLYGDQTIELIPRPLNGQRLAVYRSLKKAAENVAKEKQIAPELLGRKRLLEDYVISSFSLLGAGKAAVLPETFGAWRIELLSEPFKNVIEGRSHDQ